MSRIWRFRAVAAAAVALGVVVTAAPTAGAGRSHTTSASAHAAWHFEDGCYRRDVQVTGYTSSTRIGPDGSSLSEVGAWIGEYDACTGASISSWYGATPASAAELRVAGDLQQVELTAGIPVVDSVTGAASVVSVDLVVTATALGAQQTGASHFHAPGSAANWSGKSVSYVAIASGSVSLDGRQLAVGSTDSAVYGSDFGETLIERQRLLALEAAGALGGPATWSHRGASASWSEEVTGCRGSYTTVGMDDTVGADGVRTAYAFVQQYEFDVCTGAVEGFWGSAPLDDLAHELRSLTKATLSGQLEGRRLSGEPVSIPVELEWTGVGARGVWELTLVERGADWRSTWHHSESWRDADVTGTIGGAEPAGELTWAGLRREANVFASG